MGAEYYTLQSLPDLTLAKYCAEESGGVNDVVKQHAAFYRQLNRKGLLFGETYHLAYIYDPDREPGRRLSVHFCTSRNEKPVCVHEVLEASPLSSYFSFHPESIGQHQGYIFKASLTKKDGYMQSSSALNSEGYYVVNPWKPNEQCRLMGLFRMMKNLNRPAAYSISMKAVDYSEKIRDSFSAQIQYIRNSQKLNAMTRDENAEHCLRLYERFFESLRSNPHFICKISAYANNEALAKMILDAAASEAVEEGNYRIYSEKGLFDALVPETEFKEHCLRDVPTGMSRWNSLFLLKETVPFSMFPVLYPGENIEIPKESAPVYEKQGLYLGTDNNGYDVYLPLEHLVKHGLIAGMPGSGKTHTMLSLSSQIAGKDNDIPILILEPAKKEYRALALNRDISDLLIFSPGSAGAFPLRINPFEFPVGVKLSEHITNLIQVFEGAFDMQPPMPFLISSGIDKIYRDHGWFPTIDVNDGTKTYPTIRELYDKVADLLDSSDYAPEIKSNLKSFLQVRLGSLIEREMGNVFDVPCSSLRPEEWIKAKCVIELEALGSYASNFLTLLLLTIIREVIRNNPKADNTKPRHVIFLEEAHNLIGPTTIADRENGDTKVASTKFIVDMLAEVRALHEAIIIADQIPTALATQVTKNTALKVGHKITAEDDRAMLASTMSADGVQYERMATFNDGQALCIYDKVQKPFEIQIFDYPGETDSPDNEALYSVITGSRAYEKVMNTDCRIMLDKFRAKRNIILNTCDLINKEIEVILHNRRVLEENPENSKARVTVQADEIKYARDFTRVLKNWQEYLLEIAAYTSINRLKQNRLTITRFLLTEAGIMNKWISGLSMAVPDECNPLFDEINEHIRQLLK